MDNSGNRTAAGRGSVVAAALWRSRWLIVVSTVLAGLAGYLLSSLQAESYTATSRVVLSASGGFDPVDGRSDSDPQRFAADQMAVLTSDPVLERVATQLGTTVGTSTLAARLKISAQADSDILDIQARAATGDQAAELADAVVDAYRDTVRAQVQEKADAAASVTTSQDEVASIRARAAAYGDGVAVFQAATLPTSPSTPAPRRNALLAAALAALVTSGVALWRRDVGTDAGAAALAEAVEAPLVGVVALAAGRKASRAGAGFDMALVALDYVVLDRPGPVLVTGLDPRGSSAAVVLGLAAAAGRQRRVLVVDADVRGRSLVRSSGAAEPGTCLEDWNADGDVDRLVTPLPELRHERQSVRVDLAIMGQGQLDRPREGTAVRDKLRWLSDRYDLVLVHAGPLPSDPSSFALLGDVGTIVLVAGAHPRPDPAAVVTARRLFALAGRACDALVYVSHGKAGPGVRGPYPSPGDRAPSPVGTEVGANR